MADETVTTATPAPAAPVTTATIADVIAKAEARADGGEPAPAPKPPAPTIDIAPETLKQLTTLQRKNRELAEQLKKAKPAELDADATNAIEAAKLFKEGKRLEAIAKLTGKNPDEELTALLETYIAAPADEAAAAESELAKKVDAIAKEQEELKKARDEEKAAKAADADKQAQATALAFADRHLDADKFRLCAKPDNRAEAAQAALDGVVYLAGRRKIELDKVTEAEAAALFGEVYEGVEAQYVALGKKYTLEAQAAEEDEPKPWTPPPARSAPPGVTVTPPRKVSSLEDIIARAEERARP